MLTTAQGKQVLQASQGGKYSMHPACRELSSFENWKYLYWKQRKSPGISLQKYNMGVYVICIGFNNKREKWYKHPYCITQETILSMRNLFSG